MALLNDSRRQAIDANGNPYSGALLYVYTANTTTPISLYSDSGLSVPLSNPVVADSSGRFSQIFADEGTTVDTLLKTAGGVTITSEQDVEFLGTASTTIERDFTGSRLKISNSAGTVNYEAGDASPDNIGGKLRFGGWAGTQADTLSLDAAAISTTGNIAVTGTLSTTGAVSLGGTLTLADGSIAGTQYGPVPTSGRFYAADTIVRSTLGAGTAAISDRIYWLPFSRAATIDQLYFNVNTGVAGNSRIGLYTSDATTGLPSTLIEGSGAISTAVAAAKTYDLLAHKAVTTRLWIGVVFSANPTLYFATVGANNTVLDGRSLPMTTPGTNVHGYYSAFAYAALPNAAPAITAELTDSIPYLAARVA